MDFEQWWKSHELVRGCDLLLLDGYRSLAYAAYLAGRQAQREVMLRKVQELHHAICHSFINNDEIGAYRMACEHFEEAIRQHG